MPTRKTATKDYSGAVVRNLVYRLSGLLSGLAVVALTAAEPKPEPTLAERGAKLYQQHCASCHGQNGEGVQDQYSQPLLGDRSLLELTKLIDDTMPEGEPEAVNGEEVRAIAAYIYEAFYSEMAQVRNRPARVALSRLAVRQHREILADLIQSFRWQPEWDQSTRGLQGKYYNSRRQRKENLSLERVDAQIAFDFGEKAPDEKSSPEEFFIKWQGGLLAPETGIYDFILKSDNGARLWLNEEEKPFIDAGVKSGDGERRESIFLIAGRIYPIRLEVFKNKEAKEKKGSIFLSWKIPHRVEEIIPGRYLSPKPAPTVFVPETPFPPDDRSIGYERGNAISKAWNQSVTAVALETANYILLELPRLANSKPDAKDFPQKVQAFCLQFAERAFRRPLSDAQRQMYVESFFQAELPLEVATKRSLLLVLTSPYFLYREVNEPETDAFDVVNRLSFALWDSIPDEALRKVAARQESLTADTLRPIVQRMVNDLRTKSKMREFLHQWLRLDHLHDIAKNPELFPEFDPQVIADLRTSLDIQLDELVWGESSDFRQLLLTNSYPLNNRLASFYGVSLPSDAGFQAVPLEPEHRAGILTHPLLLAGFAYHSTSSPIHRGVFISRSVLGRSLRPPPEAVTPTAPELQPHLTTRERVELQTSPTSCQTCHGMINPLGFALESFDAVGRFRAQEKEKPINAAGYYFTVTGTEVHFNGTRELAEFLANSPEVHAAFVEQLFHYLIKQPIRAYNPKVQERLVAQFQQEQFQIRKLLQEIALVAALEQPATQAEAVARQP